MVKALKFTSFIYRIYRAKNEIDKILLLSCLFSVALSFTRALYTHELLFLSLIWNLFLGFIPFAISRYLMDHPGWIQNNLKFAVLFTFWLLFIPNSFYIITDLFHLEERSGIPMWFDLALIFSFAWNGLLLGILSVRQMEKMMQTKWKWTEAFFIYPIMSLNAFGVYLGRYLRYNSWDIISNPFQLVEDIIYLVIHPIRNRFDWSMIVCYAVFMSLLYLTIKKLSKELR